MWCKHFLPDGKKNDQLLIIDPFQALKNIGGIKKEVNMKAQSAIEYLVMVGIALVIIIPLFLIFSNYVQESSEKVLADKLNVIGNEIINNAKEVYYLGEPSKVTLNIDMPDGVQGMSIENPTQSTYFLVFDISGDPTKPKNIDFSSEDIKIECYENPSTICTDGFPSHAYSQGLKKIRLEAEGTSVKIYAVS